MGSTQRLNKALWNNITRLKLLEKPSNPYRFILESNPFDDEDDEQDAVEKDEYVIRGRIFPNSDIYKEGSYKIEIKLTSAYPFEAPVVQFLTPIYHPNIAKDGTFCHHLLSNSSKWKLNRAATLVDVIKVIIKFIDEPDPDYAVKYEIGKAYMQNKEEFNRIALEMVKKHALPRN